MSIRIIKQGLLDSIQDMGRYGYQHQGINPGGVMDTVAAVTANILVGNEMTEAVIEMHFPAATIHFEKAAVIAISGADFSAAINNEPVPLNTGLVIAQNSTLSFTKYLNGARAYLAIQGGLSITPWLNSYSTNNKANAGGYHGRALKKDDLIHCRAEQFAFEALPASSFVVTPVTANTEQLYNTTNRVRCIEGTDFQNLQATSQQSFLNTSFSISMQSDRMGYRLSGDAITSTESTERISAAVIKGSIQLLPDGQLIILMADHQTTGGYPVIAHVISADINPLAQKQPGTSLMFSIISLEEAEQLYITQQQYLQQLQDACNLQLKQFFS
ncbi:biotin-dependent carboxyltransferase family protein [Panacibacter ginsenosidivorans]|uniref:Biotin-dependent carboxyltransferase family protein n=1 Tax=Panacibacter ginsenosidivorans TaxID=1813871 RepID=A0A5B8VCV0_9BACT|nr:biotin-dependent carboxyltransferase family protein [Panacibacter ginsenosidivorans]QEC68865.1 biotin-dependent carboxyltransferase family protein [Panacibacter ginsenosidivorans]